MTGNGSTCSIEPGQLLEHEDFFIRATEQRLQFRFSPDKLTSDAVIRISGTRFHRTPRFWSTRHAHLLSRCPLI